MTVQTGGAEQDTIERLQARIEELEAIPRDEADGYNKIIAHLQERIKELEAPVLPDDVARQAELLRKLCMWHQAKGTSRDNGYPYHKHLPDCEICRTADLLERQAKQIYGLTQYIDGQKIDIEGLQERIEELEEKLARGYPQPPEESSGKLPENK